VLLDASVGRLLPHLLFHSLTLISNQLAGKDATDAFFGLHRQEVLQKSQYARLQIGKVRGQEEVIKPLPPGEISNVPYAEPTWLSKGYHSAYYTENHRAFQKALRKFLMEVVQPEALECEESGKRISQPVIDKLAYVILRNWMCASSQSCLLFCREINLIAMRLGPGKHLKGKTLMGGLVKPEEFNYFHEVCLKL
jgi:hypothetical protein